MKLKHLASALEDVPPFPSPNYELEQYKTGAELAARVLFAIQSSYGDLEGRVVLDFGCGTGILGIGAAILGATHVVGVDCDPAALATARETADEMEVPIDFVRSQIGGEAMCVRPRVADVVVMNPPFGTRRPGADVAFVRAALDAVHAEGVVYSLHKSSTRMHLVRTAESLGVGCQLVAQLVFDIPSTYAFHTEDSADVDVDLLRFVKGSTAAAVRESHASMPPYVPVAAAAAARAAAGPSRGRGAPGGRGGARGGRRGARY